MNKLVAGLVVAIIFGSVLFVYFIDTFESNDIYTDNVGPTGGMVSIFIEAEEDPILTNGIEEIKAGT